MAVGLLVSTGKFGLLMARDLAYERCVLHCVVHCLVLSGSEHQRTKVRSIDVCLLRGWLATYVDSAFISCSVTVLPFHYDGCWLAPCCRGCWLAILVGVVGLLPRWPVRLPPCYGEFVLCFPVLSPLVVAVGLLVLWGTWSVM